MKVLQTDELRKKVLLHAYDKKILALLCKNVRLPISKMAHLLRLSRQSVEYRIKVMEDAHLIEGSRAVINIKKLGYLSYHYFFTLQEDSENKKLKDRALASEDANALITYSGKYTHELSIMARSPAEAQEHFLSLIAGLSVKEYFPCIILSTIKGAVLPELQKEKLPPLKNIRNDPSFSKQFVLSSQNYESDEKDRELLYLLSQDAQMSLSKAGKKLHLSGDAVSYRIKRLIRAGYLLEFRPVVNFEALSYRVEAILMKVERSKEKDKEFQNYLKNNTMTLWATELFGEWNYLIYVLNTPENTIHDYLNELKKELPGYLSSYELLFAYQQHKYAFMTEAMRRV